MKFRTMLFGGTIISAGMTAQAQQFIYLDSGYAGPGSYTPYAFSSSAPGTADDDKANAPDLLNTISSSTTVNYGSNTFETVQTQTGMGVRGEWDGAGTSAYGTGNAVLTQFFEVSYSARTMISWNGTGVETGVYARISEEIGGADLFLLDDAMDSGSVIIDLLPGVAYEVNLFIVDGGDVVLTEPGEEQFIYFQIVPSPGVGALVGVVGLAAARRRRPA